MAGKKRLVPERAQDATTVNVAGRDLAIVGTNRACMAYEAEFGGNLVNDILVEHNAVLADEERFPSWARLPKLLRAIWAMARAAGSTKAGWADFSAEVEDAPASMYEPSVACNVVFGDFGETTFFRLPPALADALASDDGQPGDGE